MLFQNAYKGNTKHWDQCTFCFFCTSAVLVACTRLVELLTAVMYGIYSQNIAPD